MNTDSGGVAHTMTHDVPAMPPPPRGLALRRPFIVAGVGIVAAMIGAFRAIPTIWALGGILVAVGVFWAWFLILPSALALFFSARAYRPGQWFVATLILLFSIALISTVAGQDPIARFVGGVAIGALGIVTLAAVAVAIRRFLRWRPRRR